jgi:hypothetical protein
MKLRRSVPLKQQAISQRADGSGVAQITISRMPQPSTNAPAGARAQGLLVYDTRLPHYVNRTSAQWTPHQEIVMTETERPTPPMPAQQQNQTPGRTADMTPRPDHGEHSYKGSGRLAGKAAIVTGGDSGIGRAVAIAFAREGADVLIAYLDEDDDARETGRWVEEAGRKAVLLRGDIRSREHCNEIVERAVEAFGRLDVLVNNAAYQMTYPSLDAITDEEWDKTFDTNIGAMFRITRAAVRHMKQGGAIVNTSSINADHPNPGLIAYATTKGAIQNFTGDLAQFR